MTHTNPYPSLHPDIRARFQSVYAKVKPGFVTTYYNDHRTHFFEITIFLTMATLASGILALLGNLLLSNILSLFEKAFYFQLYLLLALTLLLVFGLLYFSRKRNITQKTLSQFRASFSERQITQITVLLRDLHLIDSLIRDDVQYHDTPKKLALQLVINSSPLTVFRACEYLFSTEHEPCFLLLGEYPFNETTYAGCLAESDQQHRLANAKQKEQDKAASHHKQLASMTLPE